MCQLHAFVSRAITAMSDVQRHRVVLARAIAPCPRFLLLDELLSALDASLRDELAVLLRGLDIIAIFVAHDQIKAMAFTDDVAAMSHGRVAQSGTPKGR
ncbi:MAG: hypothetical protein ABJP79_01925 [Tateyamaria sp.]|uniref:hypothetical protein n=1 Tax=Tateyamaria sp. TaxID=1929288 RepID=UPI00329E0FE6